MTEQQLDAFFDDLLARLASMIADCPPRRYRADDTEEFTA